MILKSCFQNVKISAKIAQFWKNFLDIYGDLRKTFTAEEVDLFSTRIEAWIKDFLFLYQVNQVTPYMHALWAYVPDFLTQGLEKCNEEISKCYFRATNHRVRGTVANHAKEKKNTTFRNLWC